MRTSTTLKAITATVPSFRSALRVQYGYGWPDASITNPSTRRSGSWKGATRHSDRASRATYARWTMPYRSTSSMNRTSDGRGNGLTAALRRPGG
eukprot:10554158-Lingulodinium_polyedra.AAC.1